MWNHHSFYYGGFMMWIGLLLVIVVIYFLFKNSGMLDQTGRKDPGKDALEILKERYAKGEISEEEFRRMKDNLK